MMNDFENWLDRIRLELYEDTKTLTNDDAVETINKSGRKIAEKYGIPVVKPASVSSGGSAPVSKLRAQP